MGKEAALLKDIAEAAAVLRYENPALGVEENDALDDSAALAAQPACGRSRQRGTQAVGNAPEAAPVSNELPAVGVEDDVAIGLLRETETYLAQGYRIAPPLGVKELAVWSAGRERRV